MQELFRANFLTAILVMVPKKYQKHTKQTEENKNKNIRYTGNEKEQAYKFDLTILQGSASQTFWSQDSFKLLKIIEVLQCGLYLLLFTVLHIKTQKFLKDKNIKHAFHQLSEWWDHYILYNLCKIWLVTGNRQIVSLQQ